MSEQKLPAEYRDFLKSPRLRAHDGMTLKFPERLGYGYDEAKLRFVIGESAADPGLADVVSAGRDDVLSSLIEACDEEEKPHEHYLVLAIFYDDPEGDQEGYQHSGALVLDPRKATDKGCPVYAYEHDDGSLIKVAPSIAALLKMLTGNPAVWKAGPK